MSPVNLSGFSMLDLFREEVEPESQVLISGLLALERNPVAADQLEACMRASHSLKGAARIVGLAGCARLANALEDCFVAAQQGRVLLQHAHIDSLLRGVDLFKRIAMTPEADMAAWADHNNEDVVACLRGLQGVLNGGNAPSTTGPPISDRPTDHVTMNSDARDSADRVLRVTAESLNRLLGLAGESLVESRWARSFAESLLRLKRLHHESIKTLQHLRNDLAAGAPAPGQVELAAVERGLLECQRALSERLAELEMFHRRSSDRSHRMYDEALACRMRPFADGLQAFPRMVRDLARSLGKQARLDIVGEAVQVDRDILQKLDAPLGHLLRNAVDHGLETPAERRAVGKPAEGVVRLEARHNAGTLQVSISDDGRGVNPDGLRTAIVVRKRATAETARTMSEAELLDFLFLPGFTMKEAVTEISGRGVGLDVVQDMVKQVRGTVRMSSHAGTGTRVQLLLPVTLSVVRTLLVDIGGEPYAFPLASVGRAIRVPKNQVNVVEGHQHFDLHGRPVGLVTAHQVLGVNPSAPVGDDISVVVLGDATHQYGLIVDRFLGERELVVQPLDSQLGKVKDIAAGALMEDGSPVLIVDTDDVLRSIDKLCSNGPLTAIQSGHVPSPVRKRKRVLIVDDSLTVRELERKLLGNLGYDVEVAVDGMDGWNAIRTGQFNLVVTDIDMPRMDGIELVTLINKDPNLKSLPVMVVSYKDRDEDRRRGLEAGAAYYLTKGSFHDETLAQAVIDLIGEADV